jgi:hypothetical protein
MTTARSARRALPLRASIRKSVNPRAKKPSPSFPMTDQIAHVVTQLWTLVSTGEAEKVDGELERLLVALGLDPASPTAWRGGFLLLGSLHYGVGKPRRTNRNARKFSADDDFVLLCEMSRLTKQGLSPEQAINTLAGDERKANLFRFKAMSSCAQRADVLRKRLKKILDARVGFEALAGSLARTTVEQVLINLAVAEVEKRTAILGRS